VQIRASPRRDQIQIQVIDNGIGISPLDKPRLFEKFYRGAQSSSKETHGTGLGLAITKSIVERHGGRIWVESQLGKGSTFTMLIPVRQESIPEHQEPTGLDVP
jgi:two-component system, OmpR family, phosphate regulon sensor histidine kinase PhoR